jgi:hypothetical protein
MLGMLFYLHEIDLFEVVLGSRLPHLLASISDACLGYVCNKCPAGQPR